MKGANQNLHEIQSGKTRVKSDQSRLVKKVMRDFPANRSASLARQLKKRNIEYFSSGCPTEFPVFPLLSLSPISLAFGGRVEEKSGNEVAGCRVKTKLTQHS